MPIDCHKCRKSVLSGRYCDNCGASLEVGCEFCGAANRAGARFCAQCGRGLTPGPLPADIAVPAQHKQVTVLFADICGSTEIVSNLDPEDASLTLGAVLDVITAAVTRAGGLVNQLLGDGIMALFGAPVAAEDHAARACFAALAILEKVAAMGAQALPVRVGLCSGPVILRRTGLDESDYEVSGITAHIAARLEQRAQPGTILLAAQTLELVPGVAHVEALGPVELKGIAGPQHVYRLISASDQPSWIVRSGTRPLSPFVGRAVEMAKLGEALRRTWDHQSRSVTLVGDAGMGKSRLVHEFLDCVPAGDWHVIRVATTARSTAIPYILVSAMLRQLVGATLDETLAGVAERLPAAIAALGLEATCDLSPLLFHLGQDEGAGTVAGVANTHRAKLVDSLVAILRRSTELRPTIVVLEDFHWLDASSIELLNDLRPRLEGTRLLLLVTTRPERRPNWAEAGESSPVAACTIELPPLNTAESEAMLSGLVGIGPQLGLLRAYVATRAGGTPFFIEELAQSLHEQGAVAEGLPSLAHILVPASVQGILAARIDRLDPSHRRILQVAAVIGRIVPSTVLTIVADLSPTVLTDAVAALHGGRFLVTEPGSSGALYGFQHALTHSVVYETLLRSDRQSMHERVFRALECLYPVHDEGVLDNLAHHASAAKLWPEAARYAMIAGERASRRSAPAEAKAYLHAAIVALDQQPATLATISQGIDARLGLRGVSASLTDVVGMHETLQTTLAEADQLAAQTGDRLALARVYISRGAMLSHWGDLSGAIELSRKALDVMQAEHDQPGIVAAAFTLAQALWYSGDFSEAETLLSSNIDYAYSEIGQQRSSATFVLPVVGFLCYLARVQAELGKHPESFDTIAEARRVATQKGSAFDQVLVDINEGAAWLAVNDTAQAAKILERALAVARAHTITWHIPSIASLLGRSWTDLGRNEEARELLEDASALSDRNRHVAKRLLCSPPLIRALAGAPFYDFAAAHALADQTMREAALRGFRPIVQQTEAALLQIVHPAPASG